MCLYGFFHVLCLDPHPYMLICLDSRSSLFMCLDLRFHMFACLNLGFHMLVCLDLCSACFMPSSMCLCAPCHVCVPRPRLCLSCHVLLQPFCRFIFLSCILAYWLGHDLDPTVFVIVRRPWPILKGLDRPICMSMLSYFYALCLCQLLLFQALLCLTPLAGCSCMVTSDTHEALFGCNHLGGISVMLFALYIPLPFLLRVMICLPCLFATPVGFLCIFTCLLTCSCMSLACQRVVHASTQ